MLYWPIKFILMKIVTDNRINDIIYVDRANLQQATTNDIVKLLTKKDVTMANVITNFITGEFCLNRLEKNVLEYIINFGGTVYIRELVEWLAERENVSTYTVRRAINKLIDLRVLYIGSTCLLHIASCYKKAIEKCNIKKLLIIELQSEVIADVASNSK